MAAELCAAVLGWDWAMAGLSWCDPVQAALRSLDQLDHRRVGWSILCNLAEAQLRQGRSVVLDGKAHDPEVAMVREVAERSSARCLVVMTRCDDLAVVRRRIDGRDRAIPGWSELTWEHVVSSRARWVPPTAVDAVLDTAPGPDPKALAIGLLAVHAGQDSR